MFFQTLTLLNLYPYSDNMQWEPWMKFLCKVEWKCVQVIKILSFKVLQKMCLTYHINTDYIISIIVKITESFLALFYEIPIRNSIYSIHNLFFKKNQTSANVAKYNFQSIIVNLTQSKQKSKLCGLFIGLL